MGRVKICLDSPISYSKICLLRIVLPDLDKNREQVFKRSPILKRSQPSRFFLIPDPSPTQFCLDLIPLWAPCQRLEEALAATTFSVPLGGQSHTMEIIAQWRCNTTTFFCCPKAPWSALLLTLQILKHVSSGSVSPVYQQPQGLNRKMTNLLGKTGLTFLWQLFTKWLLFKLFGTGDEDLQNNVFFIVQKAYLAPMWPLTAW